MIGTSPPAYNGGEEAARARLRALEDIMRLHQEAKARHDEEATHAAEIGIVVNMRLVGDAYPDEESRSEWYTKAAAFERGNAEEKEHILMPLAKGLGILIAAPFVVAAGAIFAAGAIVYGAGKTVMGLGNILTWGAFS